jgi:hypothetical protein
VVKVLRDQHQLELRELTLQVEVEVVDLKMVVKKVVKVVQES